MTHGASFDDRLRERFASPPRGAVSREDCPEAERLRLAARGHVPFSEVQGLLDHAAACAACAVAWRLAREQAVADGDAAPGEARRVAPARPRYLRYAAAAAIVLAVGGGVVFLELSQRPVDGTALRATGEAAIRAAIPDGTELARSAFVLRWTPGPAGTRYVVLVTDERLAPIAEGANLGIAEFRVPESALAALPLGTRVLWQVRAVFPDGTRIETQTFVARVAGEPAR